MIISTTALGIPARSSPRPNQSKDSEAGRSTTHPKACANPLATIIIPRLATKGGTPKKLPLSPRTSPTHHKLDGQHTTRKHAQGGRLWSTQPLANHPGAQDCRERNQAPHREIDPAVTITKVIPIAIIAITAIWFATLSKFEVLRKLGQP